MKRRIAAFISRKRKEVDEWNVQEFCGRSYIDEQDPAWGMSLINAVTFLSLISKVVCVLYSLVVYFILTGSFQIT